MRGFRGGWTYRMGGGVLEPGLSVQGLRLEFHDAGFKNTKDCY